jgi:23S rRNA-/tRNA-specific pseudouridylate synthase
VSAGAPEHFWAQLPLGRGVSLLTRDAHGLAAFNKPAGVLSHPNERGDEPRALLNAAYVLDGEYFEWRQEGAAEPQRLWLLNRLDSATSGVILAAADATLAASIRAQFKRKTVRKIYFALVFGVARQPAEIWRDLLSIEKRAGQIRTAARAGNIAAECRMSVIRASRGVPRVSLLRLEPRTGRSHQLRVQCAKRQLPIVGDQTYGDFRANREFAKLAGTKRMFLHSAETSFDYELGGARVTFAAQAPLPAEFEKFL